MKNIKTKKILTAIILCLFGSISFGQVTFTVPNFSNAVCTYPSNYFTIPSIVINEASTPARGSFALGTDVTIVINAPANFEFDAGSGSVNFSTSRDISSAGLVVNTNELTITFTVTGTIKLDKLTISGVRARALSAATGSFVRTGGTAVINGDFIGNVYATAIVDGIYGIKSVGPAPSDYLSLTEALNSLRSRGVSANTILELKPNYDASSEIFPLNFQSLNCLDASRGLTIRPNAAATNLQIVSSNITATINFNGTNYVTIEGRAGGSGASQLTISNTANSATAIQMINGSGNNVIQYCTIKGVNTGNKGIVLFGSSTAAVGNCNNNIQYCDIEGGVTTPNNAIVSTGSAGKSNRNIIISNNLIHDYFNPALDCSGILMMSNTDSWTIDGNSFYLSGVQNFTSIGAAWSAIQLNNKTNGTNIQITNNFIGGQAPDCGGSAMTITGKGRIQLIEMNGGAGTASEIQGNTITNISFSSNNAGLQSFIQHLGGSVNIGTTSPNNLGSQTQNNSVVFDMTGAASSSPATVSIIALGLSNTVSGTVNCNKNVIGGINVSGAGFARLRMIDVRGSVYQYSIKENILGSTLPSSISNSTNAAITGIYAVSFHPSDFEIISNTIRNFLSDASVATEAVAGGIYVQAGNTNLTASNYLINKNIIENISTGCTKLNSTGCYGITAIFTKPSSNVISGNNISSLAGNTTGFAGRISAINITTTALAPCLVRKNFINSLLAYTGNTYTLLGITHVAGKATYANNVIRLGLDANGTALTGNHTLIGIAENGGSPDLLYNTIYITGSNTMGNNISIGFSSAGTGNRNILNNIFRNNRSNSTANNYAISVNNLTGLISNNNNLLADGTNGQTGFSGGMNRNTLADWQIASANDGLSIAQDPLFNAPNSINTNFNISSASPSNNTGTTVSPANSITDDYSGISRSATTPDMGAFEMSLRSGFWTGALSRQWNDAGNWEDNLAPTINTDVTIAAGLNNLPGDFMPLITTGETGMARNLKLELPQSLLSVTGTGKLQVSGNITNLGTLDFNDGTLELNGNSVQTIAGSLFKDYNIKNLIISNDVDIAATPNDTLKISNELSFGNVENKTLNTGNNITFISNLNNTARLADLTNNGSNSGNTVTGNVTAERYLKVNGKAWQFLASPTNGQSVKNAWQEGASAPLANPNPGYGTIITGRVSDAIAQGFDVYTPAGASILSFNENTGNWLSVGSASNPVYSPNGYLVLVRGDRSVTTSSQSPISTTLRTSGTIFQPSNPPVVLNVQAGKLQSVANPYLSAIDFSKLDRTGGVADMFYLWDPLIYGAYGLGGWQTFTSNFPAVGYSVSPGGGSYANGNTNIQSGQAFLVSAPVTAGTISFKESAKVAGSDLVFRMSDNSSAIITKLYAVNHQQAELVDGTLSKFDAQHADEISIDDALKMGSIGASLSINSKNIQLAVEKKKLHPVDSVNYEIHGLVPQEYQLTVYLKNIATDNRSAILKDTYTGKEKVLNMDVENLISFTVNNETASANGNRFNIYYYSKETVKQPVAQSVKPVIKNTVSANDEIQIYPNPVVGKKMNIYFPGKKETYQVKIYTTSGTLVLDKAISVSADEFSKQIMLPVTLVGMYHVKIFTKQDTFSSTQVIIL